MSHGISPDGTIPRPGVWRRWVSSWPIVKEDTAPAPHVQADQALLSIGDTIHARAPG